MRVMNMTDNCSGSPLYMVSFSASPWRIWSSLTVPSRRLLRSEEVIQALDLESSRVGLVGIVDDATFALLQKQLKLVLPLIEKWSFGLALLIPWQDPPSSGIRFDGQLYSFVCSPALLMSILASGEPLSADTAAYAILAALLSGNAKVDRLVIRQLGQPQMGERILIQNDTAVIMAHRGQASHLECALSSIRRMHLHGSVKTFVGLDDDAKGYRSLCSRYPEVRFYYVPAPPCGHFYIKQHLIELCKQKFIAFHDSDDVSCDDRIIVTLGELARTNSDIVGCHELRLDEINQKLEVYRFPLDVVKALEIQQQGAQLHASTVVNRSRFLEIGGLSTDLRIANDTQFRLRAFFSLRMRNVDAFLYIRRRHQQSLTMAPETALGCPLRAKLRISWEAAFAAIRQGNVAIEDSSLRPARNALRVPLIRM